MGWTPIPGRPDAGIYWEHIIMASDARIKLGNGLEVIVYGWEITTERETPKVFVEARQHPLSSSWTMTPEDTRELACQLWHAADTAEGISPTPYPSPDETTAALSKTAVIRSHP
jgi:hypothetical protein